MVEVGSFTPAAARASLETSLRELGIDGVDFLLLHECRPADLTDAAAGLPRGGGARRQGAPLRDRDGPRLDRHDPLAAAGVRSRGAGRARRSPTPPLGRAARRRTSPTRRSRRCWRIGVSDSARGDAGWDRETLGRLLLASALRANPRASSCSRPPTRRGSARTPLSPTATDSRPGSWTASSGSRRATCRTSGLPARACARPTSPPCIHPRPVGDRLCSGGAPYVSLRAGEFQVSALRRFLSRRLVRAGVITYVFSSLTLMANLVTGIVVARGLGPDGRGITIALIHGRAAGRFRVRDGRGAEPELLHRPPPRGRPPPTDHLDADAPAAGGGRDRDHRAAAPGRSSPPTATRRSTSGAGSCASSSSSSGSS